MCNNLAIHLSVLPGNVLPCALEIPLMADGDFDAGFDVQVLGDALQKRS